MLDLFVTEVLFKNGELIEVNLRSWTSQQDDRRNTMGVVFTGMFDVCW